MPDLARVRATISYGQGGPGLGTFYFAFVGATPTGAELTDMAARVRAFYAALASVLANTVAVLVQGNIDTIDRATGVLTGAYSTAPPAAVAGTGGAVQMAPTVCVVARLVSNQVVAGRILQGRSFVGPLATGAATGAGAPTVAVGTATTAAITALLAVASTESPVIWHRPKAPGSGTSGTIIGGQAWSAFGSLRSRRD